MANIHEILAKSYTDSEQALSNITTAGANLGEKFPVISTGSHILNDCLGCGGLPKGRIMQFYGRGGSGKTLMAMVAIVEAQKEDPAAYQIFIDAENTFSPSWANTLGVDVDRVMVIDQDSAQNGRALFEAILGTPKENAKTHVLEGKKVEGWLDKIIDGTINVNLIVLDSLGNIIPPGEDISAVGKANMALMARFLGPTLKKLSLEVSKAQVPFIIINHTRDTLDPYASSDHTYSGGNDYTHALSANIYFEAVMRKDAQILDEKENKIGHTIRATVEKSKFGPWPRKCEFKVNFGIGVVDKHEEIAQLALDWGVVSKPSSVSHEYNGEKWVGFPKYCEAIKESQQLAEELLVKIDEAREAKRQATLSERKLKQEKMEQLQKESKKNKKDKQ